MMLMLSKGYSNIIFDKNDTLITDLELNYFQNLYKKNYDISLSNNKAKKEIYLIKKTINFLIENNPELINEIDKKLSLNQDKEIFKNKLLIDFLRYEKIKSELVFEYFRNDLGIDELKLIFSEIDDLILPISKNNCLTIEKVYQLNNDVNFINSFLENIKSGEKNFKTVVEDIHYSVCLNDEKYKRLEKVIYNKIKDITLKKFQNFSYGKIN